MRAALVLAASAAISHGFMVAKQIPVKHVGVSPVQYGEAVLDKTSPTGITVQLSSTLPTPSSQTIAWGLFADNMNTTGWPNMEIHGLRNANDSMMSYAAGALEGVMTWSRTYDFLLNAVVDAGQTFPKDLTNWLNENTAYAQKQAALNGDTDPFWYQTGLFFTQLQGLYDGYSSAAPKNKQVPWLVFYAATLVGDLFDLDVLFPDAIAEHSPLAGRLTRPGGEKSKGKITPRGMTHCSSMVGLAVPTTFDSSYASPCAAANANPTDVFMSHSTWAGYESMSRIFKMIDMPVATTGAPNAPIVPGTRVSFSSYPATLYSSDDVYATSAGLLIQETTINNYNESLYKEYTVPQTVLTWARVMVASRLATDGQSFSDVFLTQNSGTYNNAWQILTKSKFTPGRPLQDGLLMVVEQLPGYTATHDRTDFLRQQCGYYSYNVIQDPFLAQISGQDELEKELGPLYSYAGTSRALIFAREMHVTSKPNDPSNKAIDLAAVQRVMRLNEFETDPLSIAGMGCEGGARNSANAIASRYDLNKESSDSCDGGGRFGFGSIDSKVTSLQTAFPGLTWLAISGPTYQGQPVFAYSNSTVEGIPHRGLPNAWQFPWVTFSYDD